REFTHLRGHHGQHPTNAETGDKARDTEADRVAGQPRRRSEQAEQRDTDRDHLRPAYAVSQGTEEHGTQHGAEQRRAGHDAGAGGIDAHIIHYRGQRRSYHGQIVAVDYQYEHTPEQNESVETVEFRLAGKLVHVHRLHSCTSFLSCSCFSTALWACFSDARVPAASDTGGSTSSNGDGVSALNDGTGGPGMRSSECHP